jgi:hypothetical protein
MKTLILIASLTLTACGDGESSSKDALWSSGSTATAIATGGESSASVAGASSIDATGGASSSVGGASESTALAVTATGGSSTVDACAAMGGVRVPTVTMAYMYFAAGGKYECQWLQSSATAEHCVYSTSAYQSSTDNICTQITNARSCAYSYSTDKTTLVNEIDYYNVDLFDSSSIGIVQADCAGKGGVWR